MSGRCLAPPPAWRKQRQEVFFLVCFLQLGPATEVDDPHPGLED